jgi:cytochrome c biogenesis protein CcdA
MTVSFFTKKSKSKADGIKNALLYGISIIAIYVLLGTIVTTIFGPSALNALSTNVWFNLLFFVLLVVFAISFLGAFEIMLPNSWLNKADKASDKGGFIGIFFMALALALVSFSCTGPIVGTLLVESATIGGIAPFVGMFGFSLALAIPFTLFADNAAILEKNNGRFPNFSKYQSYLEKSITPDGSTNYSLPTTSSFEGISEFTEDYQLAMSSAMNLTKNLEDYLSDVITAKGIIFMSILKFTGTDLTAPQMSPDQAEFISISYQKLAIFLKFILSDYITEVKRINDALPCLNGQIILPLNIMKSKPFIWTPSLVEKLNETLRLVNDLSRLNIFDGEKVGTLDDIKEMIVGLLP